MGLEAFGGCWVDDINKKELELGWEGEERNKEMCRGIYAT